MWACEQWAYQQPQWISLAALKFWWLFEGHGYVNHLWWFLRDDAIPKLFLPWFVKQGSQNIRDKLADYGALQPTQVGEVLVDVKDLKHTQDSMSEQLDIMKRENSALWREIASLRQKHTQQQLIINKVSECRCYYGNEVNKHNNFHNKNCGKWNHDHCKDQLRIGRDSRLSCWKVSIIGLCFNTIWNISSHDQRDRLVLPWFFQMTHKKMRNGILFWLTSIISQYYPSTWILLPVWKLHKSGWSWQPSITGFSLQLRRCGALPNPLRFHQTKCVILMLLIHYH